MSARNAASLMMLAGSGLALTAFPQPAHANTNTQWQERHQDVTFLAGRWMRAVYGDEYEIRGTSLVLTKKRSQEHADTPIGFAIVTNLQLKEVQRSNPSTVYFAFTGTCHQYRPGGASNSYPSPGISVSVSSSVKDGIITGTSSIGSSCFGTIERPPVAMTIGEAMNPANLELAADDPALENRVLNEMSGEWVSRHETNDSAVTISGREIRMVRTTVTNSRLGVPAPGTTVGVIDAIKPWGRHLSPLTGQFVPNYVLMTRPLTTNGQAWVMANWPSTSKLRTNTHEKDERSNGNRRPVLDYRSFSASGVLIGDLLRPEDKARIFGKAPLPTRPAARPGRTPAERAAPGRATPSTPAAVAPPLSIPVSSEQEQRELAERERLNREQAAFGTRQLAENEANRLAYEKAVKDREALIARQQAEHEAAVAAVEAERMRLQRAHEAAMAQWRADVEACRKGDKSKCAQ